MAFTSSVATKAGIGLGALGAGATTVYFGGDYLNNSLSKYEKALISFLEEGNNERDIVFDVKKEDGKTDLKESDITFTDASGAQKVSVSVKVQVSSGSSDSFKGTNATEGLEKIKKINGSSDWTWQCKLTFAKASGVDASTNAIQTSYKDKIFKNPDQGLLGILKKDFSGSTDSSGSTPTKAKAIQTKIDFIRHCGYERGVSKNKEINGGGSGNALEVSAPEFSFKKNEKESNLIPVDETNFRNWFN